jgi:eukaryotic-like serine/threonine-protein kinase
MKPLKNLLLSAAFSVLFVGIGHGVHADDTCGMNSILIPGGRFVMGISEKEVQYLTEVCNRLVGGCYENWFRRETPIRTVTLKSFCIDRYEHPNKKGQQPARGVSWNQANLACFRSGKRLCTESEWERACRSSFGYEWSFGYTYNEQACNIETQDVEPSGARNSCRSVEGIFDMNGNLAEWVANKAGEDQPEKSRESGRILKGGSYKDWPIYSRCSFRDFRAPEESLDNFGFRCCSSPY